MPNTPHGLPYPATTAPPNVPVDIQALADALDTWLPKRARKTVQTQTSISVALINDDAIFFDLPVGIWLVRAFISPIATAAANSDIKVAWAMTSGAVTGGVGRFCLGPGTTTANVAESVMRSSSHALTTSVPYGVDGTTGAGIFEEFEANVTTAGRLQLQWAQNVVNAAAPLSLTTSTRATAQRVG